MLPHHSQEHWLEPILERHLSPIEAPAGTWDRVRFPLNLSQPQTLALGWRPIAWAMVALTLLMVAAAGGHSYVKTSSYRNSIARASNPSTNLSIQSACHMCHSTAQL